MAKILSAREAKLQKKLIPLNIFVFIISIVAALSLFFMPILKVDIGKILSSPNLEQFIDDTLSKTVGGSVEGSSQEGIDYSPVITTVVGNVLSDVKGSISITAYDASKIALSSDEGAATAVLKDLLYGEKGLVTELIDSLIKGLTNIFKTDEGKQVVEQTVVTTVATTVVANLPEEVKGKVTEEKVEELTTTFKKLNDVKSETEVEAVVDEFAGQISTIIEESIPPETIEEVKSFVVDMYKDAVDALVESGKTADDVNLEAMICVAVSNNVDLGEFNINEILSSLMGGGNNGGNIEENINPSKHVVVDETDGSGEGSQEGERVIVTNYGDLLSQMGVDENNEELVSNITTAVETTVNDSLKDVMQYFNYYGYLFYGMLAFIAPWLILALFSFFHMFAKNKRLMMWYVKLYSFIPGLIWVALTGARVILSKNMVPAITDSIPENIRPVVGAVLDGVSTYTWISGLCFVLLWLVSIFWAFPIKHKIRKERKACKMAKKNGTYSYYGAGAELGYGATTEENYGYGSGGYGSDYGSGYGSDYGSGYGSSDYGSGYGSGYGSSYGSSDYDDGFDDSSDYNYNYDDLD
ncbi:MAG: hypothetical protein K2L12_04295 [Clostridia bacterium]|nr:hypothetical protein [Clostridia bacterium]